MTLRTEQADVVVVGGGAAGLSAALEAVSRGAVVALVSKVYPMRSHTVAAEGGAAGVARDDDSLEAHVADTVRGGAGLCEEDAVRFVVERAPAELARLERLGMPWSRDDDGRPSVRRFGGMSRARTWYAADRTGFHLLHTLFQTTLQHAGLRRFDEHVVLGVLVDDDDDDAAAGPGAAAAGDGRRARGVVAHDQQRGEPVAILAPSVVLATGGAARMYGTSTNAGIVTGDGIEMALRAGVPVRDLELVQVHPTGLPGTGILLSEAARGEGGVLLDARGERYLADYGLGPVTPVGDPVPQRMELGPRDRLSQAFWHADRDGRTLPSPDGGVVLLDLTHLGRARIDERLPLVASLALRYARVDAAREPVPVRPTWHYTMGGILAEVTGETPLAGLFAAGECASTGLHGANRLGSNSLVETLVVGRAAGEHAVRWAIGQGGAAAAADGAAGVVERARETAARLLALRGRGTEPPGELRAELGRVLDADVGIFRDEDGLRRAAGAVLALRERYADVRVADTSSVLNTDWTQVLELGSMLRLAHVVVAGALARRESRGAHQRLDFPEPAAVARHTLARWDDAADAPVLTSAPVGAAARTAPPEGATRVR